MGYTLVGYMPGDGIHAFGMHASGTGIHACWITCQGGIHASWDTCLGMGYMLVGYMPGDGIHIRGTHDLNVFYECVWGQSKPGLQHLTTSIGEQDI